MKLPSPNYPKHPTNFSKNPSCKKAAKSLQNDLKTSEEETSIKFNFAFRRRERSSPSLLHHTKEAKNVLSIIISLQHSLIFSATFSPSIADEVIPPA